MPLRFGSLVGVTYVRMDRRCPRCHAHRMHSSHRSVVKGRFRISITCAECGHDWRGRFLQDEWEEMTPEQFLARVSSEEIE